VSQSTCSSSSALVLTIYPFLDCTCIAAVAALAHFKRPDVTTSGDGEFKIHTAAEKDLIPTVLHHYPICVSYALFNEGKIPVADPTALEERVSDATLILAINSYKELCCMHLAGVALTSPHLILRCSEMAADRSRRIVEFIKSTMEEDAVLRANGEIPGFAESIRLSSIPSISHEAEHLEPMEQQDSDEPIDESDAASAEPQMKKIDANTAASSQWAQNASSTSEESSSEEQQQPPAKKEKKKPATTRARKVVQVDSSEEEDTQILN